MSTLTKRLVQAIVISVVLNTLIYVVAGSLFNVPFEVDMGGEVDTVDLIWVIVTSIVMSVAAYGVYLLLTRTAGEKAKRLFIYISAVLAALSLTGPYFQALDPGSFVALSLLHVVVGIAVIYSFAIQAE